MSGRMVVVEGLDGVGKTTFCAALTQALGAVQLSTPGFGGARAEIDAWLEGHPVARHYVYAASVLRASGEAQAHLDAGRDVVIDRYLLSTLVYGAAAGVHPHLGDLPGLLRVPDLTLLLEIDEAERQRRIRTRTGSTLADFDTLDLARRARLAGLYRTMLWSHPSVGEGEVLDVSGRSVEELVVEVIGRLEDRKLRGLKVA